MKLFILSVCLGLATSLGVSAANACCDSMYPVYRTYYLDANCNYYYTDMFGNKVVTGKYQKDQDDNPCLGKDCRGRLYTDDNYANRTYISKRCD